MPEAYLESQDIVAAVKRLRPEWLRLEPQTDVFRRFEFDWSRSRGGFWDRAQRSPAKEAATLAEVEGGMMNCAREEASEYRQQLKRDGWEYHKIELGKTWATFIDDPTRPFEAWRVASMSDLPALFGEKGAYYDWLQPLLNLDLIHRLNPSWCRFWLEDVVVQEVRREWIRWAASLRQAMRKVTEGTPGDAQLATYMIDVDYLVTADKVLFEITSRIRQEAPFSTAQPILVKGGNLGVTKLLEHLHSGFLS
ncbi:MAG: hypothetical protein QM766_23535 [Burkholderiaceae bacterium]